MLVPLTGFRGSLIVLMGWYLDLLQSVPPFFPSVSWIWWSSYFFPGLKLYLSMSSCTAVSGFKRWFSPVVRGLLSGFEHSLLFLGERAEGANTPLLSRACGDAISRPLCNIIELYDAEV